VTKPSQASGHGAVSSPSVSRADAAADAIASVRAEGLHPGPAEPLLAAWARSELTGSQLDVARLKLLSDRLLTVAELLPDAPAA
jgi:hypothetical protein